MTNKIKTVFIADTILEVRNTVRPVTTSLTTSKVFKTSNDVYKHKCELYDTVHAWNTPVNEREESLIDTSKYDEELTSLIKHNNDTRQFSVDKHIQDPQVSYREVAIADLTAEQKVEFEKLYDMKIVEETFEDKVVKFKTPSKVYAVENDTASNGLFNETVQ